MAKPWKRLGPWLPGGEPPHDGDAALSALADVAEARRSLEQAELSAVRTARRHGKSWTEIATMLAVTRQSAWERWRDLDADGETVSRADAGGVEATMSGLVGRARRRPNVAVPDLIGFTAAEALGILTGAGLDAVSATPEIELRASADDIRAAVVVQQYPEAGTRIQTTSIVRLWLERGDGEAGVREPRRPTTPPRAARAQRDELTEEAVG